MFYVCELFIEQTVEYILIIKVASSDYKTTCNTQTSLLLPRCHFTWVISKVNVLRPNLCWPVLLFKHAFLNRLPTISNMVFYFSVWCCVLWREYIILSTLRVTSCEKACGIFALFKISGDCQEISPVGPQYPDDNKWRVYLLMTIQAWCNTNTQLTLQTHSLLKNKHLLSMFHRVYMCHGLVCLLCCFFYITIFGQINVTSRSI